MENLWILAISFFLVIRLNASLEIKKSVNGTNFMEGTPAKLSCVFPPDKKYPILLWNAYEENVKFNIKCRTITTCETRKGYTLTRNNNAITLIINEVNRNYTKWECSILSGLYSQFIQFKVIVNPPLHLNITISPQKYWIITTSCSNPLPTLYCENKDKGKYPMKNIERKNCSTPLLSYITTKVPINSNHYMKCFLKRGQETFEKTGVKEMEPEVEELANCIYRIKSSCENSIVNFACTNNKVPMHFKVETEKCVSGMKKYYVELKSLLYGNMFNCTLTDRENDARKKIVYKRVLCHIPYYTSGGIFITLGLILAGAAVTSYLFKIGTMKHAELWKTIMWYFGVILADIGVLLFLWTISWRFVSSVFFPFFLLLLIKNTLILLIGFYVRKNGGFFFVNSRKSFSGATVSPEPQTTASNPSPEAT